MVKPGALCVSLTPRSLDEVFSSDLAGADCAEVRFDYLSNPRDSLTARWDRLPIPVIATCRGKERGGKFEGSAAEEIRLLQQAAENGARFVDLDYRIAEPIAGTDVIASFHDFEKTPRDLTALVNEIGASPGRIGKIATMVNSWDDNRRLFELLSSKAPKPMIVIGMGDMAQITRVLGPSRGSFLTYAGLTPNAAAPGQLSLREMNDVYRFRSLKASTRLIGIIGNPLGHSFSPVIHNKAFAATGLDFVFVKFPVADVKDFFENVRALGIEGLSVTIPHKTAVIPLLGKLTAEAAEIGAVNTVSLRDGIWTGDNTDVDGVRASLDSAGFDPKDKVVVILGTGGASKAAVAAVKGAKRITTLGRREVPEASQHPCDLLINATPVGMFPMVDAAPFQGPIPADVVMDMVYNPPITRLLRSARDQGKTVIQGTTMFLAQAARQFEIWTGHRPPSEIFEEK
ncbi:MAG TPA: type I 3-dehydroquinate dehydratase [Terriglobia bacterium]|jgi:3-dehydroquinate dehydratase/shikimate dehydrogenase